MRTFFSLFLFIVFAFVSFWLLQKNLIHSNDFVLLVISSSVIALVISYFDEIQELSIGGNIVKLKEANKELQETIEQLKSIKLSTFRMLLLKSLHGSGTLGSGSLVDSRSQYFFSLIVEIKEAGCFSDLKQEIEKQLKMLINIQLNSFFRLFNNRKFEEGEEYPKAMYFYVALNNEIIDKVRANQTPKIAFDQKKQEIISAIDTYAQLYIIASEVGLLEHKQPNCQESLK